jgi:hypothetical protein
MISKLQYLRYLIHYNTGMALGCDLLHRHKDSFFRVH